MCVYFHMSFSEWQDGCWGLKAEWWNICREKTKYFLFKAGGSHKRFPECQTSSVRLSSQTDRNTRRRERPSRTPSIFITELRGRWNKNKHWVHEKTKGEPGFASVKVHCVTGILAWLGAGSWQLSGAPSWSIKKHWCTFKTWLSLSWLWLQHNAWCLGHLADLQSSRPGINIYRTHLLVLTVRWS